jgi:hypothetical protein
MIIAMTFWAGAVIAFLIFWAILVIALIAQYFHD